MATSRKIIMKAVTVVLLVSLIIPLTKATDISPVAQTEQGIYIGRQITTNGTNINYWYGMPYAQQPIGNLRWMPPQALLMSNDTQEAYSSNSCPQAYDIGFPRTEACLVLNVYAPEKANNLPVYVWIHGGGFNTGSGMQYNATPFVSTSIINSVPIVIVTINYRLGLFGFLADEGLYSERSGINNRSTTGNYGILDQIMALDWIKKNIAGFGGNPDQITVGGQSGGGISIAILLTSSLVADGTFQRAIVQSGSIWPNLVDPLQIAISKTGNVLRTTTNCTTVQCLRNLTVPQILAAQLIVILKGTDGFSGVPVIDDYVLNDIIDNYFARGNFQRLPLLIGTTANETTLITCPIFNGMANSTQVQAFLKTLYNTTIMDEIPMIYGPASVYDNPLTYLNIVYSDAWMHCGARRIASRFASYGLSSYLYTYNHSLSGTPFCEGVTHNAELPMFFPPYFLRNYTLPAWEQQLSANMMLYWAHFIYNSNPNYSGNPANWDVYRSSIDNDFVLGINPQMRTHYYNSTCSYFWDRYAVTNSTSTSFANTYISTYQYFLLLFSSICLHVALS